MNKLMRMLALACAAWLALPAGAARAAYPDKPIRLIVSFPPGSGTDSNARYVAKKMEERLGVAVTVENRPGGNSFIAAQAVAAADPDGYTLLLASNSPVATNAAMFKHLPYDPVKDFAPVARLGYGAMALAVKADAPYKTVADLVNAARLRPGELNFGSGSASYQIATELFLSMGGIKANHVPYRGAAPALTDLAGGQVDFVFADYGAVIPFVQSGRMRLLAVTGDTRLKSARRYADTAGVRLSRLLHGELDGGVCPRAHACGHHRYAVRYAGVHLSHAGCRRVPGAYQLGSVPGGAEGAGRLPT